jgi:tetratricopeptide (TPR) repeat protein
MGDYEFNCPHCKQLLEAPADMLGQSIDCPNCNKYIQLPKSPPVTRPTRVTPRSALSANAAPPRPPPDLPLSKKSRKNILIWSSISLVILFSIILSALGYRHYSSRYLREYDGYLGIGNEKAAYDALERHLVLHPDDLTRRREFAEMLTKRGNYERATELYWSIVRWQQKLTDNELHSLMFALKSVIDEHIRSEIKKAQDFADKGDYDASDKAFSKVLGIYYSDVNSLLKASKSQESVFLSNLKEDNENVRERIRDNHDSFIQNQYWWYDRELWKVYAQSLVVAWHVDPRSIEKVLHQKSLIAPIYLCRVEECIKLFDDTFNKGAYTNSQGQTGAWLCDVSQEFHYHANSLVKNKNFTEAAEAYHVAALIRETYLALDTNLTSEWRNNYFSERCTSEIEYIRCLFNKSEFFAAWNSFEDLLRYMKTNNVKLRLLAKQGLFTLCHLVETYRDKPGPCSAWVEEAGQMRRTLQEEIINEQSK